MSTLSPRIGAAAVIAAAAFAPPAHAEPAVSVDRECYSPGDVITETGTGFTPSAPILETVGFSTEGVSGVLGSMTAPTVTADAAGAFTRQMQAPSLWQSSDRREIASASFAEQAGSLAAQTQWTLSDWDLGIPAWRGGTAQPGRPMRISTWGWTAAGATLYAHYFRGLRRVKSVRVGALTGPCGDLTVRVRQFPFTPVRPGTWKVYFSATRRFDRTHDTWMKQTVVVPRPGR